MKIKGIYAHKAASFQLLVLLLSLLTGAFFSSILTIGLQALTYGPQADISQQPGLMRAGQFISAIGTFLLPSWLTAWLCSENISEYLFIRKTPDGKSLPLVYVCVILLSPFISLLGLINKQMQLPAFMAPVEEWMRTQENLMGQLTRIIIGDGQPGILLANLVVIAITAGITEEFLFRGALQRIIGKWTSNHHIIIWSTAILFSAFHIQFYGFLPRMILGAYFGYLLYWSKSIWIPVFAHFANNATAVIGMSTSQLKNNEFITGDIPPGNLPQFYLIAALSLALFTLASIRLRTLWRKEAKS